MSSPFPGMDPYLEAHWRDVHTSMMTYIRDQIQDQLPFDLVARVEESVSVDTDDGARLIALDVHVVEDFEEAALGVQTESVAVAEPLIVLEEVPQTARHVQILDVSSGERVVTAIEVLSPTNKLTLSGREDYRRKQRDYLNAGVNLVEIDLLRGGQHVLAAAPGVHSRRASPHLHDERSHPHPNKSLRCHDARTAAGDPHSAASHGSRCLLEHPADHRPSLRPRPIRETQLPARPRAAVFFRRCRMGGNPALRTRTAKMSPAAWALPIINRFQISSQYPPYSTSKNTGKRSPSTVAPGGRG
jgi:uncharacterized protein DUF4058